MTIEKAIQTSATSATGNPCTATRQPRRTLHKRSREEEEETETHPAPERKRPGYPLGAAEEAARDRDAVRDELAGRDEAEDRADRSGPREREEAEQERRPAREPHAVHRRLRPRVHAVQVARERQPAVA